MAAAKKKAARKAPAKRKKALAPGADRHWHKQAVRTAQRARDVVQDGGRRRRSITADKRQKAKRKVPSGQGDRGDRR
jgi:hypothetical protein